MPRPTAVRLAYGSATVVCSTVVLLLLFPAADGAWTALVGAVSLLLGVRVALGAPAGARGRGRGTGAAPTPAAAPDRQPSLRR
ncbi:hypothetical protein [Streptomyces sp. DH12]|uniref:hypothetical protein n=1 Tax=Streptomyces sp. DH12 TaxID=2857010 RepID=UPI001E5D95DA|nr:hypothetical protein [Streptomyces sp. DH12]